MLPLPGLKELLAKISPQPLWMMVSYYLFYTYMLRMSHNLHAIFWAKKPANYYSYPSQLLGGLFSPIDKLKKLKYSTRELWGGGLNKRRGWKTFFTTFSSLQLHIIYHIFRLWQFQEFFSMTRTMFSQSRSEQFFKQNTIALSWKLFFHFMQILIYFFLLCRSRLYASRSHQQLCESSIYFFAISCHPL